MGDVRQAMKKETIFFALCYELAMEAVKRWPRLRFAPWFPLLLSHCLPFWTEWKTSLTLQKVDEQAKELVEQWEKEEREVIANKLATKAQELFPQATITPLPDAIVPSVMIVHEAPPEASDAVKALGGELRITWQLQ
jgi:hypothetical protein